MAHLDGLLGERLAVHPPLGLEHGLNDVPRFTIRILYFASSGLCARTCRWGLAWDYPLSRCIAPDLSASLQPPRARGIVSFPTVDLGQETPSNCARGTNMKMRTGVCVESAFIV